MIFAGARYDCRCSTGIPFSHIIAGHRYLFHASVSPVLRRTRCWIASHELSHLSAANFPSPRNSRSNTTSRQRELPSAAHSLHNSAATLDNHDIMNLDTPNPPPTFAKARPDKRKRLSPQCIAHRGYKAKCPENSMLSFRTALEAGADALETDIHFTKDEIVVLSHDPTLNRCFGQKKKILDHTWDEIKDLRTLAAPHVPMPTFKELLEFLAQPEQSHAWVLLDIKLDNNADQVMRLIAKTIAEVTPLSNRPWEERIVLGIWAAKFLSPALQYSPGFPIVHIGASISYARHFLTIPKIGFNMLLPSLLGPGGGSFIRDCQGETDRTLIAWTVNDKALMHWCIRRKLDGIITDDPAKFIQVRDGYDENTKDPAIPLRTLIGVVRTWVTIFFLVLFFKRVLSPVASPSLIEKTKR